MFRKSVDRFRLSLSRGNVAPDGVMVGLFYGAVYRTVKTLQVRADQYVVYPEIEFVLVVRDAQPASRLGEGIIHVLADDAVGIRDRGIVEVAAYYDVGMFGAGNGFGYAVGLRGTLQSLFRRRRNRCSRFCISGYVPKGWGTWSNRPFYWSILFLRLPYGCGGKGSLSALFPHLSASGTSWL